MEKLTFIADFTATYPVQIRQGDGFPTEETAATHVEVGWVPHTRSALCGHFLGHSLPFENKTARRDFSLCSLKPAVDPDVVFGSFYRDAKPDVTGSGVRDLIPREFRAIKHGEVILSAVENESLRSRRAKWELGRRRIH